MAAWWKRTRETASEVARPQAVAYYRHSAQDRQENSVPLQREQVQKWAADHGIEIIKEFADHGKSGLSTEHRDAFNEMIEEWVKKRDDFQYVLVLDVSRWGRFQDTDLSAVHSAECTKHGKKVIYTTIGIPRTDDPLYPVYVSFERFRAAQYSRELSDKVFKGCVKISQQGYRAGGGPPYGMRRLLLDEARAPVQVLNPGERKSIQNQRVTLTPGDADQIRIVRRIFQSFADGADESSIAEALTHDGVLSPGEKTWTGAGVRHILMNEMYAGTLIYNKTTQRLLSKPRPNPADQWVRTPQAFKEIISKEMFDKAQAIFSRRRYVKTRENMLGRLGEHLKEYGFIKGSLIQADNDAPSVGAYHREFGDLDAAFLCLFDEVLAGIRANVRDQLLDAGGRLEECDGFLVLNECLTVIVQPSVPIPYGCKTYWSFHPDRRPEVDITLGVPLSDADRREVLGYLALPRLIIRDRCVRLYGASDAKLDLLGYNGLELLKELAR